MDESETIEDPVAERFDRTVEILQRSEVPEGAFGAVFQAVYADVLEDERGPTARSVPIEDGRSNVSPAASQTAGTDPLDRLAARLKVEREIVESVFYFGAGDEIEITVLPGRFESAKSRATEQIALLVTAARQGLGVDEEWTSVDPIRVQAEHFKRFDASNFAGTIKGMDGTLTVRGQGRDRKVRMTAVAWQKAGDLVRSLAATG